MIFDWNFLDLLRFLVGVCDVSVCVCMFNSELTYCFFGPSDGSQPVQSSSTLCLVCRITPPCAVISFRMNENGSYDWVQTPLHGERMTGQMHQAAMRESIESSHTRSRSCSPDGSSESSHTRSRRIRDARRTTRWWEMRLAALRTKRQPDFEYRQMLARLTALRAAPTWQPRPTVQLCQVRPWLGKLYEILNDKYDLGHHMDVDHHVMNPDLDFTACWENYWVEIPLRGVRPARPNLQGAGKNRTLFYGVNSWKWIVPILQAGFLKPSELPQRNAGDKSCPKLFGGFSVGIAEKYACPHMFDGKWLQVMFVVSMLHAVKHPKNSNRARVFHTKYPEAAELVALRLRISPCPPQKYHLHVRSPFDPPDWVTENDAADWVSVSSESSRTRSHSYSPDGHSYSPDGHTTHKVNGMS